MKAKAVRLRNRHGKYLVADDDQSSIRQSRNGSSQKSTWTVEFVSDKRNKIRLKSCHGLYLTATAEPFLLGMTGKKVIQNLPATKLDASVEWEPIKEGTYVKLRTNDANFLRANWGTPPWRNSVTHDIPHRSATQDWILWEVEVLDFRAMPVEYDTLLTFSPSFSPAVHMLSPYPGPPVVLFKHEYSPVKMLVRFLDSVPLLFVVHCEKIIFLLCLIQCALHEILFTAMRFITKAIHTGYTKELFIGPRLDIYQRPFITNINIVSQQIIDHMCS